MEADRATRLTTVRLGDTSTDGLRDERVFAKGEFPAAEACGRVFVDAATEDGAFAAGDGRAGFAVPVKHTADRPCRPARSGVVDTVRSAADRLARTVAAVVPPLRLITQSGGEAPQGSQTPSVLIALHPHRNRVAVATRDGSTRLYVVRIYDLDKETAAARVAAAAAEGAERGGFDALNATSHAHGDAANATHDMTAQSVNDSGNGGGARAPRIALPDGVALCRGRPVRVLEHAEMRDVTALAWKPGSADVLAVAIPGAALVWHTELDVRRLVVPPDAPDDGDAAAHFDEGWAEDAAERAEAEARRARKLGAAMERGACVQYGVPGALGRVATDAFSFSNAVRGRLMAATSRASPLVTVMDLAASPRSPNAVAAQLTSTHTGVAAAAFTEGDQLLVRAPVGEASLLVASTASWAETRVRLDSPAVDVAPAPSPAMSGKTYGDAATMRVRERVAVLLPQDLCVLELAGRTAVSATSLRLMSVCVLRISLSPAGVRRAPTPAAAPMMTGAATRMAADLLGGGARVAIRMDSGDLAICAVDVPRKRCIRFREVKPSKDKAASAPTVAGDMRATQLGAAPAGSSNTTASTTGAAPAAPKPSIQGPLLRHHRREGHDSAASGADDEDDDDASDLEDGGPPQGVAEVLALLRDTPADAPFGFHDHRDPLQPLSLFAVFDPAHGALRHIPMRYSRR